MCIMVAKKFHCVCWSKNLRNADRESKPKEARSCVCLGGQKSALLVFGLKTYEKQIPSENLRNADHECDLVAKILLAKVWSENLRNADRE